MKRILILFLIFSFIVPVVLAGNMDALAEKKVTIKSEIERGIAASDRAASSYGLFETSEYIDATIKAVNTNKQNNTYTDAFSLGLNLQSWYELRIRIDSLKGSVYGKRYNINYYDKISSLSYAIFREKQKALDLTDEQVLSLMNLSQKGAEQVNKWIGEEATKKQINN